MGMPFASIVRRVAVAAGLAERAHSTGDGTTAGVRVRPPLRTLTTAVTMRDALELDSVYRAFFVLQTAAEQLELRAWQAGQQLPEDSTPLLLRRPDPDQSPADFFAETITSLAGRGNAYLKTYSWKDGRVVAVKLLPPLEVTPWRNRRGEKRLTYAGKDYTPAEIAHLRLLKLPPPELEGLGPVQAAQRGLRGHLNTAAYGATFMTDGHVPNGVLTTDQHLTPDEARRYKEQWAETQALHKGPAVLGKGLDYRPLMLKPSEAQWLEAQQFGVGGVARLFGMPARYLLAAIEGSSETYANVEQEDIAFVRLTLMRYLGEIENALGLMLPRTIKARFDVAGLLRSDTLTRYRAHAIGIGAGFLLPEEARATEGLPWVDPARLPKPSPTQETDV